MTDVSVERVDVDGVRALAGQLADLYAVVYAEPPYGEGPEHVGRFTSALAEEVDRPGFSLVRARAGGVLAGASYGWTMPAGDWFSSPIGPTPRELVDVPKFAVMEWMVRAPYRLAGVGRRLLALLLADRREPYAVLASNPAAPARQLYERLGWRQCGRVAPRMMPPMDVLAIPLR